MDRKSHALALKDFLIRYTLLWKDEIMNEYPESISHYPLEWIQLLDSLDSDELYAVDCKLVIDKIRETSFAAFMQEAIDLTALPKILEKTSIPHEDWAFNGVKKKKRHEIEKIVPKIKEVRDELHFDYVVDVGGGVGHLARILSHYHSIPSISIDRDPLLQKTGEARIKKYRKLKDYRDVKFVNFTFGDNQNEEKIHDIFKPQSFSLGLHTCGALANILLQKSVAFKTSGLLSFGCCYHRMNPISDFPLSNYYKGNYFFKLNMYSLSLATRSHAEMTRDDYNTKERVKQYRYALHLFLIKYFNKSYFWEVGECPVSTYWGPFSNYVSLKLKELNLENNFTDSDFNHFYADPMIIKELRTMWLCNIVRWQMGRALEVYLLLDRCLYLEEQGYTVHIEQYFNEIISPRNIGILALRP